MKKIFFSLIGVTLLLSVLVFSCKKSDLNQIDPNAPTPTSAFGSENGLVALGAGLLQRSIYPVPNEGNGNIFTVAQTNLAIMGDEQFVPYGNYGFRYVDQVYQITVPGAGVITTPIGTTQQAKLQSFNSITAADLNAFQYEWINDYFFISQCNQMLDVLTGSANIPFSGNAAIKRATFEAWAYWWKGLSYSRLGSLYLAGIIANPSGAIDSNYVIHDSLIVEANKDFDNCVTQLNLIDPSTGDYNSIMSQLVLSFNDNTDIITPAMWEDEINTYKARNLLVNKKVADMQPADWQQIITLCNSGQTASDFYFKFGMDAASPNLDLSNGFLHPLMLVGPAVQFAFLSERLVQDIKPGDARFTNNVIQLPYPPATDAVYGLSAISNIRSRGLQFGTRWAANPIEDGGAWASGANVGYIPFGTTYEENALMLAEAYINTGQIDQGLGYVDQVRDFQASGLPHVSGTGLTLDQAKEELRRERRVGLCQRGLAFFDARRWGVTQSAASGGGRANAIVYLPQSVLNSAQDTAVACFMNYDYMDYWDVPANELNQNAPAAGSAPVSNP